MRLLLSAFVASLCLLTAPATLRAEDVLKPTKAQTALRKALKKLPPEERDAAAKARAIEYLAQWEATGKPATGAQRYALAQFQQSAEQYAKAREGFAEVSADTGGKEKTRDYAASAEAQLLLFPALRKELGMEAIDKATERLCKYTAALDDTRKKARIKIMGVLARVHDAAARAKDAHDMRMKIIEQDPGKLSDMAGPIMAGLVTSTHEMDKYDGMRKEATTVLNMLRTKQGAKRDESKKKLAVALAKLKASDAGALGEDGRLKKTSTRAMSAEERAVYTAQRSFDTAESVLSGLDAYEKPMAMLGTAAPEWTVEKAFGEVSTIAALKGKVVILDFFSTALGTSNLPLLRQLNKLYGEKGLQIVGVTTTQVVVYESRYDVDADFRRRDTSGGRLRYYARLSTERTPANPDQAVFDEAEYRTQEMDGIAAFLKNHEINWPVVLIQKDEPAAKYASNGGTYLMVLDKQGRIRYAKAGSIAPDQTAPVAALKKVIEALLAE